MASKKPKRNAYTAIFPVFLLCGLTCLGSCATGAGSGKDLPYAYLTDTSRYILLPTGGIGESMDMAQYISASFRDSVFLFASWVKADETAIEITLLNEMGTNIGELSYRGGAIAFSSAVFPSSVKPEYIIADFQLCFYRAPLLEKALRDCGLTMETSAAGRRVTRGKELIYEIEKNDGKIKLTNYLRGYTYTLEGDFS